MNNEAALDVFVNSGLLDKNLAKDIKEELAKSGKELWECLMDFGIIGAPEDFWNVVATEVGAQYISLADFYPRRKCWI